MPKFNANIARKLHAAGATDGAIGRLVGVTKNCIAAWRRQEGLKAQDDANNYTGKAANRWERVHADKVAGIMGKQDGKDRS